jgi:hypothetical protein
MDLGRNLRTERSLSSPAFSPELTLEGGEVRLVVGSPSFGSIPFENGRRLRVRYGIAAKGSSHLEEVGFRILIGNDGSDVRINTRAGKETAVSPIRASGRRS